jgi:hypothetical protein
VIDGAAPEGGPQPADALAPLSEAGGHALFAGPATTPSGPFNETGCTAGAPGCFPFASRRMLVRDAGVPHLHLIDLGNPANDWSVVSDSQWAHGEQLVGIPPGYTTPQVMGGRANGYEYYDLQTGRISHVVSGLGNTTAAYRLRNGNTMLTEAGGRIAFLDPSDQPIASTQYAGYGYVRIARPAPPRPGVFGGDTVLVPSDTTLFEGDLGGHVLKTIDGRDAGLGWGHIWQPIVRKDGVVLLATAFGASVDAIDWSGASPSVGFRYGTRNGAYSSPPDAGAPACSSPASLPCGALDATKVRPNYFTEPQLLPNGNVVVTNGEMTCGGAGCNAISILEFNPAGQVVWYYQSDSNLSGLVEGVLVLDGLDATKLNVQDTDDGTWQAVP